MHGASSVRQLPIEARPLRCSEAPCADSRAFFGTALTDCADVKNVEHAERSTTQPTTSAEAGDDSDDDESNVEETLRRQCEAAGVEYIELGAPPYQVELQIMKKKSAAEAARRKRHGALRKAIKRALAKLELEPAAFATAAPTASTPSDLPEAATTQPTAAPPPAAAPPAASSSSKLLPSVHRKPRGRPPTIGAGEDAPEAKWDEQVGCWRTPGGSVHDVQRHKKRKLDAETKHALCERVDSDVHHDVAAAAADATAAATAVKFHAEAAASGAAALAAARAAYVAARRAAPTQLQLMKLNLCELDASFCPLLTQVSGEQQHDLWHDAGFRAQHDVLWSAWATELRIALESAVPGCKVGRATINCGTQVLEGSVTSTLVFWRRGNYWEEMHQRLEGEGSSLSRAEVEGCLRQVMEAKVRAVATQLLARKLTVDSEIAARALKRAEERQAEARAAQAERARRLEDKQQQLMSRIGEHGACVRCGFDGAGDEPVLRAYSMWEGRYRHGLWPAARGSDYERSHECSCRDHEQRMHSGFQRLRCNQCGWEVPNFLKPESQSQPAVPPSAQLPVGSVYVAPLLAVGYPEPPHFTDSHGQRRTDMRSSARASRPVVHVQLRVFVGAACVA